MNPPTLVISSGVSFSNEAPPEPQRTLLRNFFHKLSSKLTFMCEILDFSWKNECETVRYWHWKCVVAVDTLVDTKRRQQ